MSEDTGGWVTEPVDPADALGALAGDPPGAGGHLRRCDETLRLVVDGSLSVRDAERE